MGFKTYDPVSALKVVTNRAAAGETAGTQQLMAGCRDGRNAAHSKVAGGAENRTGKCIGVAFEATRVGADIQAFPILSKARCDQGKNQHAASKHEFVHVHPSQNIEIY